MNNSAYRRYHSVAFLDQVETQQRTWLQEGKRCLASMPTGADVGIKQLVAMTLEIMVDTDVNPEGAMVINFPVPPVKDNDERENYGN